MSQRGRVRWAATVAGWEPDEALWQELLRLVEPEERDRIQRFRRPQPGGGWATGRCNLDAKRALVGRLLMRKLVHDVLGMPYGSFRLQRTDKGKPFLPVKLTGELEDFNFNLTHDGDWVLLASEPHHLVGVDVM
eukprot:m51a1_g13915 putative l-aminoadipate-semialdehyde dehydrogenase-phosphopantetheinyl transferase (134) ;mRNA; r:795743-796315